MTITTLPSAPLRTDTPTQFRIKADAFVAALPQFVQEVNATTTAYGVNKWISGTTYAIGDLAWSPANSQTYRRLTVGAGATDPASDATNWTQAYGSSVTQSPNNNSTANATTAYADLADAIQTLYTDSSTGDDMLVNPDWRLDQIKEGSAYAVAGKCMDGWTSVVSGSGVLAVQRVADPECAALQCAKLSCTTADASIAAGDLYQITQAVEGSDATVLMAGTSSARAIGIQFKFKSNVTGVYGVAVRNSAGNRNYISYITVPDTAEHEYFITFIMDTTGTWLYATGTAGLYLTLTLAAGSTYQGSSGAWQAGNLYTTSAQCNFMSANTNVAYLKRIRLFMGTKLRVYQMNELPRQLLKAQRYYEKTFAPGTPVAQNCGTHEGGHFGYVANSDTVVFGGEYVYRAEKCFLPALATYNPFAANADWRRNDNAVDSAVALYTSSRRACALIGNGGSSQNPYYIHITADARLT